ncbi:hypothetical protein DFS34DRAFT_599651 [Phlyctochytrium arcticum]|nr:hypothetical protein DFS34DRAFT_599651 [Phlyctochytrium arcticum]
MESQTASSSSEHSSVRPNSVGHDEPVRHDPPSDYHDAHAPPRGILKNASDQAAPMRGIHWDEDNIMLTEAQKNATMKITEPKTPYIRYDSANDMVLGSTGSVPPMELSDAIYSAQQQQHSSHPSISGGSDVESGASESESSSGRKPQQRRVSVDEWDDSEDENEDPEDLERHKQFEAMRSQHYNMKESIRKGRELASEVTPAALPPGIPGTTKPSTGGHHTGALVNGAAGPSTAAPGSQSGTSDHANTEGMANLRLSSMPHVRIGGDAIMAEQRRRQGDEGESMDRSS